MEDLPLYVINKLGINMGRFVESIAFAHIHTIDHGITAFPDTYLDALIVHRSSEIWETCDDGSSVVP